MALIPAITSLESCATAKGTLANGTLTVPLDKLADRTTIVKASGLADKLLLVKRTDGSYNALVMNCPHKNGPVKEDGEQLVCDWHGSRFDLEGAVLKGPSKQNLKSYPATVSGDTVQIMVG
jgi:nitrite reductase/ring-hydroxylating ferredoxin subunit